VVGLCLIAGILLRLGQYFTEPEVVHNAPIAVTPPPPPVVATPAEQNAPTAVTPSPPVAATTPAVEATEAVPQSSPPAQNAVTAPTEQAEPTGEAVNEPAGEAVEHAEQPDLPSSGIILVARQPVEVLARPSSSAPALYGFPAGRPFRVIGREGGFAHIQDLKSSASGWIDEAALAQPPIAPGTSSPTQPKPFSADGKPAQKNNSVTAGSEVAGQPDRRRPGLFGRGVSSGILATSLSLCTKATCRRVTSCSRRNIHR
jgi:hypothetical protein